MDEEILYANKGSVTLPSSGKNLKLYAVWTKVTVAKGKKPTLKNTKGGKLKVTYKAVTGAMGYQIQYALNKKFTPKIDDKQKFKIYISPLTQLNIDNHNRISVTDSRMLRRIVRDYQFRGYSAEKTIKNWPNVRAGENVNVFPYNGEADVFINSMHVYEIGVLKKYAKPLLEAIGKDSEQYAEAQRLLAFLRFFKVIEHDEYIPNNSLLREFIGGSIFV